MVTCDVRQSCSYVFKYVSVRTVVWSSQGLTCLSERVGSDTAQPMSTSTRLFLQQGEPRARPAARARRWRCVTTVKAALVTTVAATAAALAATAVMTAVAATAAALAASAVKTAEPPAPEAQHHSRAKASSGRKRTLGQPGHST